MGFKGPVPVPDDEKVKRGTFRKDRSAETKGIGVSGKTLTRTPPVPADLMPEAKGFWRESARNLVKMRMLAESDLPMFRQLCEAYGMSVKCRMAAGDDLIVKGGSAQDVINPLLTESRQWFKTMTQLAERFGLTPGARARTVTPAPPDGGGPKKGKFSGF